MKYLKHYRLAVANWYRGAFNKIVYRTFWPFTVAVLRVLSLASRVSRVEPVRQRYDTAISLVADDSGKTNGPNLSEEVKNWLTNRQGIKEVLELNFLGEQILTPGKRYAVVVNASWLWQYSRSPTPLRSAKNLFLLSKKIARMGLPVWAILPDTFVAEDTAYFSMMVAVCGGCSVVLQSTPEESDRFGNLFSSGPHFWTWSPSRVESFRSPEKWEDRNPKILVAATGDSKRRAYMEAAGLSLRSSTLKVVFTDYSLLWSHYVSEVKSSRFVITANWTQEWYTQGPARYQRRVSATTTTGRIWEGFAAGCVVISNSTEVLARLGFQPGVHFVELPEHPEALRTLLEESGGFGELARAGHAHFLRAVARH